MDTLTAISERKGMRKFQDQSLPRVIIENIVEFAVKAPSCKNRQPWKFAVVQGEKILELKEMVSESSVDLGINLDCIENAAAIILIFNRLSRTEEDYDEKKLVLDSISIGSAIQNILLVSQTFKLGSLLVPGFIDMEEDISSWLDESDQLVSGVLIGFPDEPPTDSSRMHYTKISNWYE